MARKVLQPLDFTQLEILNVRLQQLSSPPGSPVSGQIWYNTTNARPQWRDASANNDIYPSTSANTPSTEVLRDGSGNFSAGTITANLTGTASQATLLDDGTVTYRSGSYYLARANHTGTQLASTISNFDAQVRTSRLDQMAAPSASVSWNSQLLTNLLDPVSAQDAATKNYVDSVATGLQFKASCRVATAAALPSYTRTGNIITATANGALAAVDGVTLVLNDRLLLKDGAAGSDNGIYFVSQVGTGGTPFTLTRTTDADTSAEVKSGMYTFIEEGTVNDNQGWVLATPNPITLNSTALTFVQFTGVGEITAGNGITKTVNTLSVNITGRFTFTATALDLANAGTAGTYTSVTTDQYGRVTAGADIVTSNGIVTRTGAGTFTNRTITGTAARISMTNGDGVSGNPTIDIDATYVGQASITTLGTIGTGTWNATIIGVAKGGTGLSGASAANGTLLIGNGSGYTLATLTNGTNISITNGSGTITINTSATVLTGTLVSGRVPFANGTQSLTDSANMTYATGTGLTVSSGSAPLTLTQSAQSSGAPTGFTFTGGAHTTLTTGTEAIDVLFSLARTVQWATTTPTTQRAVRFTAPTYACNAVSQTITTAATVAISNAPQPGTNVTLTNPLALWVEAGNVLFAGAFAVTGASTLSGLLTLNTATANLVITQGAAASGVPVMALFTGAAHTGQTAGTETTDINFNLARTVTHASNTNITTCRAVRFQAPTHSFASPTGTITNAATVSISGAPAVGSNAAITNPYSLWIEAGVTRFDGNLSINDSINVVLGTSTGTQIGTSSSQKLGFYGTAPVVQQTGNLVTAMANLGLVTSATFPATSVTGILGVANGGTGLSGSSAANGTLLIGNGTGYTLATLTQGTGIVITNGAGTITIAAAATLTNKFAVSIGNGALTTFTITHNLGTLDVIATIFDNGTGAEIITDIVHATTNTLTVTFAVAPTSNQFRVVVVG